VLKKLLARPTYHLNNIDNEGNALLDILSKQKNNVLKNLVLSIDKVYEDPKYEPTGSLVGLSKHAQAAAITLAQRYRDWEQRLIDNKNNLEAFAELEEMDVALVKELYNKVTRLREREQDPEDVYLAKGGHSLLYDAVTQNDIASAKKIVENKKNAMLIITPNYSDQIPEEQKGFTPLHLAAYNNAVDMLKLLLRYAPKDAKYNVAIPHVRQKSTRIRNKNVELEKTEENMLHILIKNMYKDIIRYIESKETILDKTFEALSTYQKEHIAELMNYEQNGYWRPDDLPRVRNKDKSFRYSLTKEQVAEINEAIADKIYALGRRPDVPERKNAPDSGLKSLFGKKGGRRK
jgi:hypothetical protein